MKTPPQAEEQARPVLAGRVSEDTHKRARIQALKEGRPLGALLEDAVRRYLEEVEAA